MLRCTMNYLYWREASAAGYVSLENTMFKDFMTHAATRANASLDQATAVVKDVAVKHREALGTAARQVPENSPLQHAFAAADAVSAAWEASSLWALEVSRAGLKATKLGA